MLGKLVISEPNRVIISDNNKKIGHSSITTTELGYLQGVSSKIQDQLNSKLPSTLSGDQAGSKVLITNSSKKIGHSSITSTELSYLQGVSSKIQTQLDAKLPKSFSRSSDKNKVVVTNGLKNIVTSDDITTTELNYLKGVSSNIQNQIDKKIASPNYSAAYKILDVNGGEWTAPTDGYAIFYTPGNEHFFAGNIDGFYFEMGGAFSHYHEVAVACFPVAKGTIITRNSLGRGWSYIYFIPVY